jgi:hypothetical protein
MRPQDLDGEVTNGNVALERYIGSMDYGIFELEFGNLRWYCIGI